MKSTEIRNVPIPDSDFGQPVADSKQTELLLLREGVAQLAAMNENYQEFKMLFTTNGAVDVCNRS
jgi:hypothetical protein